jgi:hypothetical protein
MAPVRDSVTPIGGGWLGADLAADPSRWRLELPPAVRDELMELADKRAGRAAALDDMAPRVSGATAEFVSRLRDMITSGCYFALVSGFPYEPMSTAKDAYWLLGLLLGEPLSQTPQRTLVGHIEEYLSSDRNKRNWEASNALPFHTDTADLVAMLCIRSAPFGGLSQLASARTAHDLLLAEAPEHLAELYRPFPQAAGRKIGERWWTAIPVFGFAENGDFAMRHVRWHVEASQRHTDAPRVTAGQRQAMDALDEILGRPGIALDMDLQAGDLQLFNNSEIVHARTEFKGTPSGEGRLLLRIWLSFADSPELPADYQQLFGATAAGSYRGGVWPADRDTDRLGLPVRSPGVPV